MIWLGDQRRRCSQTTNKGRRCKRTATTVRARSDGLELPVCAEHTGGIFRPAESAVNEAEEKQWHEASTK